LEDNAAALAGFVPMYLLRFARIAALSFIAPFARNPTFPPTARVG